MRVASNFKITKSKVYKLVNKSKEYKPNKLKKMNHVHDCIKCVNEEWDPEIVVATYGVIGSLNRLLAVNAPDLPFDRPLDQLILHFNSKVDLYNPLVFRHDHTKLERARNFFSVMSPDKTTATMQLKSHLPKDCSNAGTISQLRLKFGPWPENDIKWLRDVSEHVAISANFLVPSVNEHFKVLIDYKQELNGDLSSNEFLIEG